MKKSEQIKSREDVKLKNKQPKFNFYKTSSVLIKNDGAICISKYAGGFKSQHSWAFTSRKIKKRKVRIKEIKNFLYNIFKI